MAPAWTWYLIGFVKESNPQYNPAAYKYAILTGILFSDCLEIGTFYK
ncbi:hypothetical protein DR64_1467 [Paraburkholderia xenovorans LB400]|jgi:hypothetical protein|nr:hypothetical protein DR64_1467 [Paraburkholderia xenovorans LB400]